jgi:hypothetical protein
MSVVVDAGVISFYLILAGLLAFIGSGVALAFFRRAILRNIAESGGGRQHDTAVPADRPRRPADEPLIFAVDRVSTPTPDGGQAGPILRRIALAHATACLIFGALAALLLLPLGSAQVFQTAVVAWAFAWPTVIVLCLLVGPDRRVQALIFLGYLGGLVILCGIAWRGGTSDLDILDVMVLPGFLAPALIWAIYAVPSIFLLLFLSRTIRTIGPFVLVFVFVLLIGVHLALSILLPAPTEESPMVSDASAGAILGVIALGALAASWPAWRMVAFLRDRYVTKQSSDLLVAITAIWVLESLVLLTSLAREHGALGAAAAAVPLLAWRLALHAVLRPAVAAARARPPSRLLLLRVFGFGRRSRRLLDLLGARWRLIGSIDLIAAPDLASGTVEPSTFIEFMRGRLARLFIRTPGELQERLAALDHRPDPDARFRINQLFCADAMWRDTVTQLMRDAALVVMDLRGFGLHRQGCVFELQTLLDTVPLDRFVLLFDKTTDLEALESLLAERWQQLDVASPNLASKNTTLRLLDASAGDTQTVRRLLAIAGSPQQTSAI